MDTQENKVVSVVDSMEQYYATITKNPLAKRMMDSVTEAVKDDMNGMSLYDKKVVMGVLSNMTRITDDGVFRDFIKTNNYGPYLPELWPLITAWYPMFPLKELVCVQDMNQDLAYIATSTLLAGTTKSPTALGDKISNPLGPRVIRAQYPTGEVFDEVITAQEIVVEGATSVAALTYYPLETDADSISSLTAKVTISSTDYDYTATFDGTLIQLSSLGTAAKGTIDPVTGIITFDVTTVAGITISYTWNIESADGRSIPTVVEDIKVIPMIAKPRVLSLKWTVFAEYVRAAQFGSEARTVSVERMLNQMYQYTTRYILDKLYTGAKGTTNPVVISGPAPSTIVSPDYKVQEITKQLNAVSNLILQNTGRQEGNRLVIGTHFKNYLEALPNTYYQPEDEGKDTGFNAPRKIGKFGKYLVYFDNDLDADAGFMTYRGHEWYDGAYYLGVFMPIVPTEAVRINISVQQAFVAMEAHRLDKPTAVVKLHFDATV